MAALALVSFTLLLTVLSIMEPLRKQGLSLEHALGLVSSMVPVMMSFTLPVATLFAATMVYGRFAQDNELLACRASGISTLALLRPALLVGGVVTVASLALSNYVAPRMMERAQQNTLKNDARHMFFQQLKTRGFVRWGNRTVHADAADPSSGMLQGVVFVEEQRRRQNVDGKRPPGFDARVVVAPLAKVELSTQAGKTFVRVVGQNTVGFSTEQPDMVQFGLQPAEFDATLPLPDKPGWYDWDGLVELLRDPSTSADVQRAVDDIRQRLAGAMLVRDIVAALKAGKPYELRSSSDVILLKSAADARVDDGRAVLTSPVIVADGREYVGESGAVEARASEFLRTTSAIVTVRQGREERAVGAEMPMPPAIAQAAAEKSYADMMRDGGELAAKGDIKDRIDTLRLRTVPQLCNKVLAEMHFRVAYGSSCFVLVALGAALGLLFRGGQFVAAFVISIVPAAAVIVLMIMGKRIMGQPEITTPGWGLAVIWAGVALMALATAIIYEKLRRL